ncbi:MAG: hypothetical protein WC314_10550 [Vulcanimicrobiota bacterium]
MTIPWQDFFRPDPHSSNRSLKKYLQGEGLELGHRDLVLIRKLSDHGVILSYAVLEAWSAGEFTADQLAQLMNGSTESPELVTHRTDEGVLLVGISGELEVSASVEQSQAMVLSRQSGETSSPLLTVYGQDTSRPGAGGMWDEDELQQESITLLDGESPLQLVEAFRHLFRAAPNGQARASVVAAALSRHREELDLEVAQKLEEIAPAFGQAMRQLFSKDVHQGCRALKFLLGTEHEETPPPWSFFWQSIRPTILQSLTRSEHGSLILIGSVDYLARASAGRELLNHQLLEAFFQRLDTLTPKQQEKLVRLIVDWAVHSSEGVELLQSRLLLTAEKDQRLLIGESLRRIFETTGNQRQLAELAAVFVEEAISAGSTAGSIALAELLRAFGPLVLQDTAATQSLEGLTERQTLNVLDIWELMASHSEELLPRVTQIYLQDLDEATENLSLLLKSELLKRGPIFAAFKDWLSHKDESRRRQLVQVGFSWSLTVENRERVACAFAEVEWGFDELWESEWRRPHLSYQRLGWLAECAPSREVAFEEAWIERLEEILVRPPIHLYFWHLMGLCAQFESFPNETRAKLYHSARRSFHNTESTQEEEREALFLVGAAAARFYDQPDELCRDWPEKFRTGYPEEVWWLAGVCTQLYHQGGESFEPDRSLVSAVIGRLLSSGEKSMQDLLARALAEDDAELRQPPTAFLPLEVSNLCYLALHSMACHNSCPEQLQKTIRRRLALFLISWGNELRKTTDAYSFRDTPLFAILENYLSTGDSEMQGFLKEIAGQFLELHRKVPDKFRLEIRGAAQQFFHSWSQSNPQSPEAESWKKVLEGF